MKYTSLQSIAAIFILSGIAIAQWECQRAVNDVPSSHPYYNRHMGVAIDVEGDWLLAGMPESGYFGFTDAGAVVAMKQHASGWVRAQVVRSPVAQAWQRFGEALDADGELLLVGGRATAVMYRYDGSFWMPEQIFSGGLPSFGWRVAVEGDLAVICDTAGTNSLGQPVGTANVYRQFAGTWALETVLVPPLGHGFGESVDIDGNLIVIGAPLDNYLQTDTGSLTVFEHGPGGWDGGTRLGSINVASDERLGFSVAVDQGRVFAGAYQYLGGNGAEYTHQSGGVFVFERVQGVWQETDVIHAPAADFEYSEFGFDVDAEGGRIAVGTGGLPPFTCGAFVLEKQNGAWTTLASVANSDESPGDRFGRSVALQGSTLAVGAPWDDGPFIAKAGSVYLYDLDQGDITPFCTSTPNSSGSAADLLAVGVVGVSQNELTLTASPVPDQPGILFYGADQVQIPFGDGFRCVGGMLFRLPPVPGSAGSLVFELDLTQPPTASGLVLPGSTWNYQAWFRDPAAGGAGFNLSTALSVEYCP